jgi:hypothetical protein
MDILASVAIQMPCSHCGSSYAVPLSDILLSHKIMHDGCPVAQETECPPVFQSRLATQSAIENLRRAWKRLEKKAQQDGGELVLLQSGRDSATRANKEQTSKGKDAPASEENKTPNPGSHAA